MRAFHKVSFLLVAYLLVPASLLAQLYFLQPYVLRLSPRWAAIVLVLLLLIEVFLWVQYRYILLPAWKSQTGRGKVLYAAFSGILALLLLIYASPNMTAVMEKFPHLAPVERLELRPVLDSASSTVEIKEVMIGKSRIATADLKLTGAWDETENRLRTSDPGAALIAEGNVPRYIRIKFWHSPSSGRFLVRWDGKIKEIDLSESEPWGGYFDFSFDPSQRVEPPVSRWIRLLTLPGWFCLALFALSPFYTEGDRSPGTSKGGRQLPEHTIGR